MFMPSCGDFQWSTMSVTISRKYCWFNWFGFHFWNYSWGSSSQVFVSFALVLHNLMLKFCLDFEISRGLNQRVWFVIWDISFWKFGFRVGSSQLLAVAVIGYLVVLGNLDFGAKFPALGWIFYGALGGQFKPPKLKFRTVNCKVPRSRLNLALVLWACNSRV